MKTSVMILEGDKEEKISKFQGFSLPTCCKF